MDTHDAIAQRTSTRTFKPDDVPRYAIERLLAAAVRAPNHKLTEPWRFAVLSGASRARYAEIKRAHRATKFAGDDSPEAAKKIEKTYREALDTPAFIVVMCAVSDDPVRREEDYGATMMAIENLLVAAAADGIGTFLRTGGIMEHPDVRTLAGVPQGYRIVGIISLGYLAGTPEPTQRRKPLGEIVDWME
ncbi:MAG: nitroreductase [Gemmatimonadales bacterium]